MFSKAFDTAFEEVYPIVIFAICLLATTTWSTASALISLLLLIASGVYVLSVGTKLLSALRDWITSLRNDQTEMITH